MDEARRGARSKLGPAEHRRRRALRCLLRARRRSACGLARLGDCPDDPCGAHERFRQRFRRSSRSQARDRRRRLVAPTAANYFKRLTKSSIIDLFQDIGGSELSQRYGASKKDLLASSAEQLFAGNIIVEADVKEKALAWLPDAMRFEHPFAEPVNDDRDDEMTDAAYPEAAGDPAADVDEIGRAHV